MKKFLLEDQDLRKFDSQLKVDVQEPLKQCLIQSSKFKSQVNVQDYEGHSKVTILVDLPFLLTPFKNQISETLKLKLEKYLS
ncbi:MAG TPA: hypothetical protein PLJ21_02220 [Pseudobdellovibrionaceae bacterium]|nr:hypothetical protein [Pseudobdellovibrionaceae bacterium]